MAGVPVSTLRLRPARSRSSSRDAPATLALGELQPLGVGGILDRAVEILGGRFAVCFGLAFLVHVPANLAERAILIGSSDFFALTSGLLPFLAAQILATVLVASIVGPRALGRGRAVPLDLVSLLELSALVLISALGIFLLFCCIAPGVAWMWLLAVVPMAYLFEPRVGGRLHLQRSLQRGVHLVLGLDNFGRWMGITVVGFLVFAPVQSVVGSIELPAVRGWLTDGLGLSSFGLAAFEVGARSFFGALSTSFEAVVLLVFYADLRTRREGLDLELKIARMSARTIAGRSAEEDGETGGPVAAEGA